MKKRGALNKSFKTRWFVLWSNGKMTYFTKPGASKASGECDFAEIEKMEKTTATTFAVTTKERVWAFSCQNEADCNEWFDAIERILSELRMSKNMVRRVYSG